MKHHRSPVTRWYGLGLAVILAVGCLVMSVGVAWARYRTELDAIIPFETRKPLTVHLGRMEYGGEDPAGTFVPTGTAAWEWADGCWQMNLAVANGTAPDAFEAADQFFRIRFVGTLGAWSGSGATGISLILPPKQTEAETEPETEETTLPTMPPVPTRIAATATRITPDTRLHLDFGDGWLFRFLDDRGQELRWTLEGGKLSCTTLDIVIDSATLVDTSLLQLQLVADFTQE